MREFGDGDGDELRRPWNFQWYLGRQAKLKKKICGFPSPMVSELQGVCSISSVSSSFSDSITRSAWIGVEYTWCVSENWGWTSQRFFSNYGNSLLENDDLLIYLWIYLWIQIFVSSIFRQNHIRCYRKIPGDSIIWQIFFAQTRTSWTFGAEGLKGQPALPA